MNSFLHTKWHLVPICTLNQTLFFLSIGEHCQIETNHINVCKPDSKDSIIYRKFLDLVMEVVYDTDDIIQEKEEFEFPTKFFTELTQKLSILTLGWT